MYVVPENEDEVTHIAHVVVRGLDGDALEDLLRPLNGGLEEFHLKGSFDVTDKTDSATAAELMCASAGEWAESTAMCTGVR